MQEIMTLIVVWLSLNFGLPASYEHPEIRLVPPQEMTSLRYGMLLSARGPFQPQPRGSANAEIVAFYDLAAKVIYLSEEWDPRSPADQSVLVHEMVHHLQGEAGLVFGCAQQREDVAFQAQEAWLGQFGTSLEQEFGLDAMTVRLRSVCGF